MTYIKITQKGIANLVPVKILSMAGLPEITPLD
jgi:hypothetical protein